VKRLDDPRYSPKLSLVRIVLDTNVLVAAVRSQLGASFRVVSQIPSPKFQLCLSLPLYLEWQDVLARPENRLGGQTVQQAHAFLRYMAAQAHLQEVHFSWRPFLNDAADDMLLELAFAAGCQYIVTHNVRDFVRSEQLGVAAIRPGEFLRRIA
jgi:putative PIN family toxin of toxin-antitoxin system